MARPVDIGPLHFAKKKDAVAYVRSKITKVGVPEDQDFFRDLLAMHPRAEEKIGCGIDHFEIRPNIVNPRDAFTLYVVRVDGTSAKFGYRKGLGTELKPNVYRACRMAVVDQVSDFKSRHLYTPCPLSGEHLVSGNSEVDHRPPDTFKSLVDRWVEETGCDDFDFMIGGDHHIGGEFADTKYVIWFRRFHMENAHMRLLHVDAHRRVTYGGGDEVAG